MKPNLSLLGGDPIVPENINDTLDIIKQVKTAIPNTTISVWTGFDIEDWWRKDGFEKQIQILTEINYIIDGRFIYRLKTKCSAVSTNAYLIRKN